MTLTISSDARWGSADLAHERARPAQTTPIPPTPPTDHRLRRRLGRKCASVLAGVSMGLGLTAARIPAASAQVSMSNPAPIAGDPVADDAAGGQSP